jgi:ATP-dependent Clp endopeptidase proteolytic subunit ClpP
VTDALTDRFRFLARTNQRAKTPILAAVPGAQGDDTTATLRLYDPIDSWGEYWGVSAKEFAAALDGLGSAVTEIRLHVNSPGGEVFEGIAILNALRAHPARVVAVVDGLAASAASFIACGADELVMARNSELMIHDAWGVCVGNAADMADMGGRLAHLSDNIASVYADKAGGTVQDWRAAMAGETWYSAAEAVEVGLADRIDAKPADDQAKARFDLSVFNYAGRSKAPTPQTPVASAAGNRTQERSPVVAFSDEQLTTLRQQVGAPEGADEATILAALTEALAERAEPQSTIPTGQVLIPAAALADLQASAATTKALADKQHARERDEVLNAFRDRFAPASRAAWEKQYDVDPEGTKTYLAAAPVIVPLAELGQDDARISRDDEDYRALFGAEIGA